MFPHIKWRDSIMREMIMIILMIILCVGGYWGFRTLTKGNIEKIFFKGKDKKEVKYDMLTEEEMESGIYEPK